MPNRILVAAAVLVLFSSRRGIATDAADWPSWRGPLANGSVEKGSFPVEFGAERCRWRTPLPG
ncbi:MAG TPA: hypothetical protein VGX76_21725, partial [Pirellulales bacterium]|nr:hypothetical protein [Pirellulales bacterium]